MSDNGMPDIPTFPVMVLIGLTVFGLAFISSEAGFDLDSQPRNKLVYTSESYGQVGSANEDFRTVNLGDFNVGEARGDILAFRARERILQNGIFSGNKIEVEYNATQPQSGEVTFEVLGREGPGAVYVSVNGQRVFQEKLVSTGTPEIELPANRLKPGINTITIGATQGGLLSSTTYSIEDVEVRVNDRKFHDYSDAFQIYDYELQDFVSSELSFSIASSVKTSPLEVYVNDNQVYSKPQVRISPEKVELNPGETNLHPGYNTVRFETDGSAKYTIENAQIKLRYLGNTEQKTLRQDFGINSSGLSFARRDDTRETISFDYQRLLPSPRPMALELNDNSYNLTPKNGRNTIEIDAEQLDRANTLVVRSNATYQMNNLKVISEKVE